MATCANNAEEKRRKGEKGKDREVAVFPLCSFSPLRLFEEEWTAGSSSFLIPHSSTTTRQSEAGMSRGAR
jgi:hypothetical protein